MTKATEVGAIDLLRRDISDRDAKICELNRRLEEAKRRENYLKAEAQRHPTGIVYLVGVLTHDGFDVHSVFTDEEQVEWLTSRPLRDPYTVVKFRLNEPFGEVDDD